MWINVIGALWVMYPPMQACGPWRPRMALETESFSQETMRKLRHGYDLEGGLGGSRGKGSPQASKQHAQKPREAVH